MLRRLRPDNGALSMGKGEVNWGFDVIRSHLRLLADCEHRFGPAQALLQFGRDFGVGAPLPVGVESGRRKECYKNAAHVMLNRNDVFYAEGYGLNLKDAPVPIEHAWVVDVQGNVIDPTWRGAADHAYFGIAFNKEFVSQALVSNGGDAGILSDWKIARKLCASPEKFEESLAALPNSRAFQPR